VAELDTGEEREELGEELGDEEVELPPGGFEKIRGDAKEEAAGVFVKGVAGGVEEGDSEGPGIRGGYGAGRSGVGGVGGSEFPPAVGDEGVDLGEVGGEVRRGTRGGGGEEGDMEEEGNAVGSSAGRAVGGDGGDGEKGGGRGAGGEVWARMPMVRMEVRA
jgi:hypothetical protein